MMVSFLCVIHMDFKNFEQNHRVFHDFPMLHVREKVYDFLKHTATFLTFYTFFITKKVVHFNFLANNWSLFEKDVVFLNKLCVVEPRTGMNISKSLLSYIAFRIVKNNPHQLN